MPLFGFRKDKKHEQSHIQATAELAKNAAPDRARSSANAAGTRNTRKFGSEKPEKISRAVVTKDAAAAKASMAMPSGSFSSATDAIIRPRITEKSGLLSQSGVYTFEVTREANKQSIGKAVKALYKVTPVKIAVLNAPAKMVFLRGRKGRVAGFRKAVVTVKKGEKIDFV